MAAATYLKNENKKTVFSIRSIELFTLKIPEEPKAESVKSEFRFCLKMEKKV